MTSPIGPEEEAFLRSHSRTFLLGTRRDGSPTGWPMVGMYTGTSLEFSTYRRSQKVRDLERDSHSCCVIAPVDGDRALILRGSCAVTVASHEPSARGSRSTPDIPVAEGIAEGAQARLRSGKRVLLRFEPEAATFVPGWANSK